MATFLKTALVLIICLILADLIGAILCLLFGIAPWRGSGALLPFAIWFVLGAIGGVVAMTGAGDWIAGDDQREWSARPEARRIAGQVTLSSALVLVASSILFYVVIWDGAARVGYFVPDSMPHTLTFFGAAIAAMTSAWAMLRPAPAEGAAL